MKGEKSYFIYRLLINTKTSGSPYKTVISTENKGRLNLINIYRLIHGLFHIALVISTRPWYRPKGRYQSRADDGVFPFFKCNNMCYIVVISVPL
jgi:hypothetical protein